MKPGLGAVVTELDAVEVEELYGLRLQLEPPLAPHIVDHLRRRDLDDLERLAQAMRALPAGQPEEWSGLAYRFHRRLYELSGRRHTVRLVVQVLNLVEPYARVHAHLLGSRELTEDDQVALLRALRAADATVVAALIDQGIRRGLTDLVASMRAQPVPPLEG